MSTPLPPLDTITAGAFVTPDPDSLDNSPAERISMLVKGGTNQLSGATITVHSTTTTTTSTTTSTPGNIAMALTPRETPDSAAVPNKFPSVSFNEESRAPLSSSTVDNEEAHNEKSKSQSSSAIILFGATGKLGSRILKSLLRDGHTVTVFVRDSSKLLRRFGVAGLSDLKFSVIQGNALDEKLVGEAIEGHGICINAAGNTNDGPVFHQLVSTIIIQSQSHLLAPRRLWIMGGVTALDIPRSNSRVMYQDLPWVSSQSIGHKINYQVLQSVAFDLDWSLMCPGELQDEIKATTTTQQKADSPVPDNTYSSLTVSPSSLLPSIRHLRITTELLPVQLSDWTKWAPPFFVAWGVNGNLDETRVTYDEVADVIVSHMGARGPFFKQRVGLARPDPNHQRACRRC